MKQERLLQVLMAPLISEKSTFVGEKYKQTVFKVVKDATKAEIKAAVEKLFNVKVETIRVSNVKPKTKRFGQTFGKRKAWKKAYVSLQEGFDINFANKLAE
jgi:large subunit ribosomal protein L23